MVRRISCALAASALAAAPAAGQIVVPLCTNVNNGDFMMGSAFWSVDVETGEFGDTGTGVFTSFTPLSLAPNNGNVATFFTEALADGDHLFQLGSAANSTVFFSRVIPSAPPNPTLQFQFGAAVSWVLLGDGKVEYDVQLVLRNLTTGKQVKCPLLGDVIENTVNPGVEGSQLFNIQPFDACACQGVSTLINQGDSVEILLVVTVRADSRKEGGSAFIGGPFFFDNFRFCNILCPIPADPQPIALQGAGVPDAFTNALPADALSKSIDQLRLEFLDLDGDGQVTLDDHIANAEALGFSDDSKPSPDLNGDGVVDDADAAELLAMLDGLLPDNPLRADLNQDGRLDTADLQELLDARTP